MDLKSEEATVDSQIPSTSTDSSGACVCESTPSEIPFPERYQDLPWREGNPNYGFRMRLYCRTGYFLTILPDGKVQGVDADSDKYCVMDFSSAGEVAEVRIQSVETKMYLAMNKKGRLYGEVNAEEDGTIFVEGTLGQYNTYLSRKFAHLGWYIGVKKSGKQKPGDRTRWGQKAIQFLPVRVET